MLRLFLYTTEHCTLCDEALDLLLSMPELTGHELLVIDITQDDVLLRKYGERIPVLRSEHVELCAPFDRANVADWLGRQDSAAD